MDEVLRDVYDLYDELLPPAVELDAFDALQGFMHEVRDTILAAPHTSFEFTAVALTDLLARMRVFGHGLPSSRVSTIQGEAVSG